MCSKIAGGSAGTDSGMSDMHEYGICKYFDVLKQARVNAHSQGCQNLTYQACRFYLAADLLDW